MNINRYKRQLDFIDQDIVNTPLYIIGAGGIGSWTTLMLAKMGFNDITVIDEDIVEDHNVASQFYNEGQLGMLKVNALEANVKSFTGIDIKAIPHNIDEERIENGLVIFAIDSMKERVRLGNIYKDKNIYIIDGRMGGTEMEIYSCEASKYLATTCNPDAVDPTPCTAKAISFNCATIGSFIANNVRLKLKGMMEDNEIHFGFDYYNLLKAKI